MSNTLELFEKELKANAMIEVLLGFWEKGHQELPGLTREFVRETISHATSVDEEVKDLLVDGHELYNNGGKELLEDILSREKPHSRANAISTLKEGFKKSIIFEFNIFLYTLPIENLVLYDFFNQSKEDARYLKKGLPRPYNLMSIFQRYSLNIHKMCTKGTARSLYYLIHEMDDSKEKEELNKLLIRTGYNEKFEQYSKTKKYWHDSEIEIAQKVFEDFFTKTKIEEGYSNKNNSLGKPHSIKNILSSYSIQEHSFVKRGTANSLWQKLYRLGKSKEKEAIEELIEKTGYRDKIKEHLDSRLYWTSKQVELAKNVLSDFFSNANEYEIYKRAGKKGFGEPFSIMAIFGKYSLKNHEMTDEGDAISLFRRIKNLKKVERNKALNEILDRSRFKNKYSEYSQNIVYWTPKEIELSRIILNDFLFNTETEYKYTKTHSHGTHIGTPNSLKYILRSYSVQDHKMVSYGTGNRIFQRFKKMADKELAITDLLKKNGFKEIFKQYSKSTIDNPFIYKPQEVVQNGI